MPKQKKKEICICCKKINVGQYNGLPRSNGNILERTIAFLISVFRIFQLLYVYTCKDAIHGRPWATPQLTQSKHVFEQLCTFFYNNIEITIYLIFNKKART